MGMSSKMSSHRRRKTHLISNLFTTTPLSRPKAMSKVVISEKMVEKWSRWKSLKLQQTMQQNQQLLSKQK